MKESTPPMSHRILIVDDNTAIHTDFRKILAPQTVDDSSLRDAEALLFGQTSGPATVAPPKYEIDFASQGQEGLRKVEQADAEGHPYALAFVDVRMPPGWDGIETVARIWENHPELPVVICTAFSDYSWLEMMSRLGHPDNLVILRKPFEAVEVMQLAHSLTNKWRLARQVSAHIKELDDQVRARTQSLQQANEALRQSEERFAKAFRCNPVPLLLWDAGKEHYVDANESFLQLTGFKREEVLGRPSETLNLFVRPEDEFDIRTAASARKPVRNRQTELCAADEKVFTVLLSSEPLELQNCPHVLLSLQDITERVHIETQLRQSQKMEVVGQIAAGVAHDFNNILAVIQGHAELQLCLGTMDAQARDSLQEISQAASRAASLTRQLLAFSRKQMLRPKPLDLANLLNELDKMLQRIIGEHITLHIRFAENLPPVQADSVNLEQVIINLAVNARDAMPKGGPLSITAELMVVNARRREQHPDAQAGTFVKLSVADQGVGMDQTVREKIFEPFFTTKAVGQGTGMGLATVYGIIKQHQGWIEVESQPGAGSVFNIFLPLAQGEVSKTHECRTNFIHTTPKHARTIMVVEDEAALREMTAKILRQQGHQVVTAHNGPEALDLWPQHRGKIDLLFTDIMMPGGMTGQELAQRLSQDDPRLRVIYSTGYTVDFSNPETSLMEGVNCLLKPYDATTLTRMIRNSLAGNNQSSAKEVVTDFGTETPHR